MGTILRTWGAACCAPTKTAMSTGRSACATPSGIELHELAGGSGVGGAPVPDIVGVEREAKKIGRNEAELSGSGRNDADDDAIGAGDHPTLPDFSSDKNGGKNGKNAGDVIQAKHDCLS